MENTIKKSEFKFINFLISRSELIRIPKGKEQDEYDITIIPSGLIAKQNKIFQLTLQVQVSEKNERFKAIVEAVGFFQFPDDVNKDLLTTFFYTNAPAILFPYVRAYISSLTALSGMEAVNLPTINLTSKELQEQLINNTIEEF